MHKVAFAVQARLDSLLERTEAIGSKTIETFEGRDDHLMYRSVRYGPVERQQSDLKYVVLHSPLVTCFVLIAASSRQWSIVGTSSPGQSQSLHKGLCNQQA